MEHWESHLRYYDKFQMNYSKYLAMLEFHRKALQRKQLLLDSGAGTGNLTLKLLDDGHEVVAVDNNANALDVLSKKCKGLQGLQVLRQDLAKKLPFQDNYFDGVASSLVVPFVEDTYYYLVENYRVLKRGGKLALSLGLPEEGVMKYVMDNCEGEAKVAGLLPKYQAEWDSLWETSNVNERKVMESGMSKSKIISMLEEIGFTNLKIPNSDPYEGRVLFISCQKPTD